MIARVYRGFERAAYVPRRGKVAITVLNEETAAILREAFPSPFSPRIPANDRDGYPW